MNNDFLDYRENYLAHYGVKGMKWGKRRPHQREKYYTFENSEIEKGERVEGHWARGGNNTAHVTSGRLRPQRPHVRQKYVTSGISQIRKRKKIGGYGPRGNRDQAVIRGRVRAQQIFKALYGR